MAAPSPPVITIDGVTLSVEPVTLVVFAPVPEHCGHPGSIAGHGHDLSAGVHCGWCHTSHRVDAVVEIFATF